LGRRTRSAAEARRSPAARLQVFRSRLAAARSGAHLGAMVGLVLAGLALLVGIGRMAFAIFLGVGVHGPSRAELPLLGVYVGMFVLRGAFVGAVHQMWVNRVITTVAFVGAGAALMNVIAFVEAPQQYDPTTALWMSVIGAAFGLAGAYGATRKA
jgi:hypothetical protein